MQIINQPKKSLAGDELIKNLMCSEYNEFYIIVAYVRKSGVKRIEKALKEFRKHGIIKAIAGIDSNNSSKEGLELLNENVDELHLYHNNDFYKIFHPKMYIFKDTSKKAVVIIGSSNLTWGGLFGNYEISSINEFNLQNNDQAKEFEKSISTYNNYLAQKDLCKKYNSKLINELAKRKIIPVEKLSSIRRKTIHYAEKEQLAPLFGTEKIEKPQKIPKYNVLDIGFWKKLSKNDVSKTSSPGQIIIPKKFMMHFPPIENYHETPSHGRQGDVYFDISFKNKDIHSKIVNGVRAIHYIPAPNHPRPNQELRFTFRNKDVFSRLQKDDVLLFKEVDSDVLWFEVECYSLPSFRIKYPNKTNGYGKL